MAFVVLRQVLMAGTFGCALAACNRDAATPEVATSTARPVAAAVARASPPAVAPGDVVETTSDYVIGISYPADVAHHPALVAELRRYADAARADLMKAVAAREPVPGAALYDLTLSFTKVVDSPSLVVVAADGSTFTGGERSKALLARFVWLPQEKRLLTAAELVPDAQGWVAISAEVRRQLQTALAQRAEADGLTAAERAAMLKSAGALIERGTAAKPGSFDAYEPVVGPDGKIGALRFVFPPLQVGSYADGAQTVQVPADVLLPHIAPRYRPMFANPAT